MSYPEGEESASVMPNLKARIGDERAYVKIPQCDGSETPPGAILETPERAEEEAAVLVEPPAPRIRFAVAFKWIKLVLLFAILGILAGVFVKWIAPFLMDKELMPIIHWETSTFSDPVLALILFTSVALFPALLLPSTPSMWVAGMTFGYGLGFLLIFSAVSIGVSLPYFIGILFYHKIQGWLEKYPKNASVIRLAGEGDWMNQFQSVFLIRVSPFPYILYNYCSVATNVKFVPYFLGSMAGMIPDVLVAIYTYYVLSCISFLVSTLFLSFDSLGPAWYSYYDISGIVIRTLADASHKHHSISKQQIIFDVLGLVMTVTTTIICTVLAKKRLKRIQMEEDLLL